MKKNGKKWRAIQKEKEERKSHVKVGEPFSKASKKVHKCEHYSRSINEDDLTYLLSLRHDRNFAKISYHSDLIQISDTECRCRVCRSTFPIEVMVQLEAYVNNLNSEKILGLLGRYEPMSYPRGLVPVCYRRISEDEVEIVENNL